MDPWQNAAVRACVGALVHVRVFTQPSWTTAAWPAPTWHYEVTTETIMGTIHDPILSHSYYTVHYNIISEATTIAWIDINYMNVDRVSVAYSLCEMYRYRWPLNKRVPLLAFWTWWMVCLEWMKYLNRVCGSDSDVSNDWFSCLDRLTIWIQPFLNHSFGAQETLKRIFPLIHFWRASQNIGAALECRPVYG